MFNLLLTRYSEWFIISSRGEGKIPHVVSFLISQGLSFKIIIDTGSITEKLKKEFGIEEKYIHEIPIPTPYVGRMKVSGIEDLFSKKDFEMLLISIGHSITKEFSHVSNSHYMKSSNVNNTDKRLVVHNLYEKLRIFQKRILKRKQ